VVLEAGERTKLVAADRGRDRVGEELADRASVLRA
jgi:hypothetical protein